MAAILVIASMVAAASGVPAAPVHLPTKAAVAARASARIVAGARIRLSQAPQPEGWSMRPAYVTVEDGRRRPAQLVEFQ